MTEAVVTISVWLLCGLGVAWVMSRRGHSALKWVPIGLAFGPLAVAFALGVGQDTAHRETTRRRLQVGDPGQGPIRVVVGLDGSAAAEEALRSVTALLGPRLGRLTLVTVSDLDVGVNGDSRSAAQARELLARGAEAVQPLRPDLVVLSGPPAATLVRFARDESADLLALGSRGAGLSRRLLGSVAQALAVEGRPPVLIVGVRNPAAT